jgi:hypothetical protein
VKAKSIQTVVEDSCNRRGEVNTRAGGNRSEETEGRKLEQLSEAEEERIYRRGGCTLTARSKNNFLVVLLELVDEAVHDVVRGHHARDLPHEELLLFAILTVHNDTLGYNNQYTPIIWDDR